MSDTTSLYLQNPQLAQALLTQQQGMQNLQQGANPGPIRSPWQGLSSLAKALVGGLQTSNARGQIQGFANDQNDYLSNAASFNPLANALAPQTGNVAPPPPNPMAGALVGKTSNAAVAPPMGGVPGGPTMPPQAAVDTGATPSAQPALASGNPLLSPDMTAATIGGAGGAPQPQSAAPQGAGATPPQAPQQPGIGVQSQQFQMAQAYRNKARELITGPYARDPRVQALAQQYDSQAQALMSVGQWQTIKMPNGMMAQQNTVSGELKVPDMGRLTNINGHGFNPAGLDMTGAVPQQPQLTENPADQSKGYAMPPGSPQGGPNGSYQPITPGARGPQMAQTVNTDQAKEDAQTVAEEQHQALAGRDLLGNTYTIRALAKNVPTGIGAEQKVQLGNLLTSIGIDPDKVKDWTGSNVSDGQLLQKKLFELVSTSVRAMGAREPGSVLMAFQRNYPSMSSQPQTIEAMTRLLDMNQHYKEDAAAAKGDYLNQAKTVMAQTGQYPGMGGFQPPSPKTYAAAALASAGNPAWVNGLQPQERQQAAALAKKYFPDVWAQQ